MSFTFLFLFYKSKKTNNYFLNLLAVTETTSELRVSGTRKAPPYSNSANHLATGATAAPATRRSNIFPTNRIQPTTDHVYETHLPSIRDVSVSTERQHQLYDDIQPRSRPKTPITSASPKSTTRPPSASISSIFNTLSKRSTENFMNSNGEIDQLTAPPSRQNRRTSNESNRNGGTSANQTPTKQTLTPQKYSGDSGVDSRYSMSPADINHQQHTSTKLRSAIPNVHNQTPLVHETITKERTNNGKSIPLDSNIFIYSYIF
jgi:hypothetical protein